MKPMHSISTELIRKTPEVAMALERQMPVVGFETTILSFGLPSPLNSQIADDCERITRDSGAVPATVAVLDGKICAGLTAEERAFFCSHDPAIRKVNLQNMASTIATRQPGALTVATSMQACALAGIRVFATGGIGGVHRDFGRSLDVSSDLKALAQYPVAVVCAGAKSILDVPATLEVLETLGVPVVGFQAKTFPLFFTRESPHAMEANFQTEEEIADFLRVHFQLSASGVLIVTPVPQEAGADRKDLDRWIATAMAEASREGVTGKRVTPFLLERLEKLSGGKTLQANSALIRNNARVAARIACAL
jgi:pseudouridine-5'-phosphate glycosidase